MTTELTKTPSLKVKVGSDELLLEAGDVLYIGRDTSCDIVLPSVVVSPRHLVLFHTDGWWATDLESKNGSFINGKSLHQARLVDSTEISLGAPGSGVIVTVQVREDSQALTPTERHQGTANPENRPKHRGPTEPPTSPTGGLISHMGRAADNSMSFDDVVTPRRHTDETHFDETGDEPSLGGITIDDLARGLRELAGADEPEPEPSELAAASTVDEATSGLELRRLSYDLSGNRRLVSDVSLIAPRGTLTAVIGPSGAGKTTLSKIMSGTTKPSFGRVYFDGVDIHANYESMKTRIGMVPQDDVVHHQLKLGHALSYASNLRLPSSSGVLDRLHQCDRVAEQLGLSEHLNHRIDHLSGGQRKRASVAMELLTEPSLLILDEPTSGLDPALDRHVMQTLRTLADADRTVIVVTHSVAYIGYCDNVLILAPGGKAAYFGPPEGVKGQFGTDEWGDIFGALTADPDLHHGLWRETSPQPPATAPAPPPERARRATHPRPGFFRQLDTLLVRQLNLIIADPIYVISLLALPIILGILPAVVPGHVGLNAVPANSGLETAAEPKVILGLLVVGAIFVGMSLTIRDVVVERAIYAREHAVGLSASAYLMSKVIVFGVLSFTSAGVMTFVSSRIKDAPHTQVTAFGNPEFELFLALGLTAWVGAVVGLWMSAWATSVRQTMPILVVAVMLQLVFNGALIPVTNTSTLDSISRLSPARWGVAAAASGIDVEELMAPGNPPGVEPPKNDPLWDHTRKQWALNMGVLGAFGVIGILGTRLRLRSKPR